MTYPPFCDIYGVFFVSEDENAAALAAKAFLTRWCSRIKNSSKS